MKRPVLAIPFIVLCVICPFTVHSQGETAVPFLLFSSSPEGNGMGGTAATQPTSDALATIANPGQLGFFALRNNFSASTYIPRTDWPDRSFPTGSTYGATAINAGYNFRDLLSLPFSLSAGIGYSRVHLDLSTFNVTGPGGPTVIGTFSSNEFAENICAGIGLEYYARLGVGMNFKKITSDLSPVGTEQEKGAGSANSSATDFGLILEVPVVRIISDLTGTALDVAPNTTPFLDFSFGYVTANVGDKLVYIDAAQADPLPRTATVGLGFEVGLSSNPNPQEWKLASFRMARQADDLLFVRHPDGSTEYQSGLGDIQFVENVILGKSIGKVTVRKGWQVQVGEILYLRGGTVESPGQSYATSGYSICLVGIMRLLGAVSPALGKDSWAGFLADHFDLQYHSSKYEGPSSPIDGIRWAALNLVVKGFGP